MQDDEITRRDFVSITVGASIAAAAAGTEATAQQRIVETNVNVKTLPWMYRKWLPPAVVL